MSQIHKDAVWEDWKNLLTPDCSKCAGLCCTALYYSKTDGFPADKPAGTPCGHLTSDYRCDIHEELERYHLKGCQAYDCIGAGQDTTASLGILRSPVSGSLPKEDLSVFSIQFELHEMIWYLVEAASLLPAQNLQNHVHSMLCELSQVTKMEKAELLKLSLVNLRARVNPLLREAAALCAAAVTTPSARFKPKASHNYMGYNFKGGDLSGQNFSSCLMIAAGFQNCRLAGANFLGADLRDADLRGADLRDCLFLTQMQINTAKGSQETRLPSHIKHPPHWKNRS